MRDLRKNNLKLPAFQLGMMLLLKFLLAACPVAIAQTDSDAVSKVPRYAQPQTRVMNAGFELGPAYWKSISAGVVGVEVGIDSSQAFAGRRALRLDLRHCRRLEKDGAFYLATPWLTLQNGGRYAFAVQARCDRAKARMRLQVFNATSKEGLQSGEQEIASTGNVLVCTPAWSRGESAGVLPAAEQDNYRFALKFSEPAVYWIDQVEISHNAQPCTIVPELEAVLQPEAPTQILDASTGHGFALLQVANHTSQPQRLRLSVQQKARLHEFAPTVTRQIVVAAQQIYSERIQFDLPFADVYDLTWEVRTEKGGAVQSGEMRLAAMNMSLPQVAANGAASTMTPQWGMHLDSDNLDTFLPILHAAGIRHLRNVGNLHWNLLEPQQGQWQWPDSLLDYLQAQGFQVLGKLMFTPKWAIPPEKARGWPIQNKMPVALEDYRRYVHTVVARYADRIQCWEIWNEVNLPRYFDGTPAEYASLLQAATAEIKRVQPQSEIAGFSFAKFYAPETLEYLREAMAQPPAQMDALSFHPYVMKSPENAGLVPRLEQMRTVLQQAGLRNPEFWITEYGCQNVEAVNTALAYHPPLRPAVMPELTYASYLVRTACLSKAAGVKYFFCYSMDSDRLRQSTDLTGLLEESWMASPKPALLAYLTLARLLGEGTFEQRESPSTSRQGPVPDEQTYLLHFRRTDGRRLSVWWRATGEATLDLPERFARAEAFDMLGNRENFRAGDRVTVSGQPIFFLQ